MPTMSTALLRIKGGYTDEQNVPLAVSDLKPKRKT